MTFLQPFQFLMTLILIPCRRDPLKAVGFREKLTLDENELPCRTNHYSTIDDLFQATVALGDSTQAEAPQSATEIQLFWQLTLKKLGKVHFLLLLCIKLRIELKLSRFDHQLLGHFFSRIRIVLVFYSLILAVLAKLLKSVFVCFLYNARPTRVTV